MACLLVSFFSLLCHFETEKADLDVEYFEYVPVPYEEEGEQIDYQVSVGDDDDEVDGKVVGVEIEVDYVHMDLFGGLAEFQNSFVVHVVVLAEHTDDAVAYEKYSFEIVDFPYRNADVGGELNPVGDYFQTVDYLAESETVFVDAPAFDIHISHRYSVHAHDGPETVEFVDVHGHAYLP